MPALDQPSSRHYRGSVWRALGLDRDSLNRVRVNKLTGGVFYMVETLVASLKKDFCEILCKVK